MRTRAPELALTLLFVLSPASAAAQLGPLPTHLDFGAAPSDCNLPRGLVSLTNPGTRPVEFTDVALDGADLLALRAAPPMPFTLAPGADALVTIATEAAAEGPWQGSLRIVTSEGVSSIALSGEVANRVEGRYQLPPHPGIIDLLFVIDDAPSMAPYQAKLAAHLTEVAEGLRIRGGPETRVAITTTAFARDGRFIGLGGTARTVLELDDPDFESALPALGAVGANGPSDHAGLWAARRAISEDNLAGPNRGFLRPYASLRIIVISNALDLSPGSVDDYANELRALYGFRRTNRMTLSAIVGDGRDGCRSPSGGAAAAPRYVELAGRLGGILSPFCGSRWTHHVEDLLWANWGVGPGFRLQRAPVISSLTVTDDLVRVPATSPSGTVNWTYRDDARVVGFSPFSYPEPRSEVSISYEPRCEVARPTDVAASP